MTEHTFSFRSVQAADLPLICTFPQSALELFYIYPRAVFPLTPAQLQANIDQRHDSTVVLKNGVVAGFANLYLCQPGEKCAVGNFIVAPDSRRKGAGKALMQEMARTAFEKYSVQEVEISCFNQNTSALLFYPKLGFHPTFIEERADLKGEKAALIHMSLSREIWQMQQSY